MDRDRLASVLSVAVLLALAGWLMVQAVPSQKLKSQEIQAQEEVLSKLAKPRAPKSKARPATAVVHLPPPPRLPPQIAASALSATVVRTPFKPTRKSPTPPVEPLRPTWKNPVVAPAVAPLTPAEPPVPNRAAPPKPRPLMPKPRTKTSTAELPSNALVAPTPPKPQRFATKPKPQATAITPAPEMPATDISAEPHDDAPAGSSRKALREGRALLRVLEHGAGPSIEIAWPKAAATRVRLYRRFTKCFGMRVALLRGDGKLFIESGPPGQPWAINLDRYSGFIRQPAGRLVAAEHRQARRIRAHHPRLSGATPIRVFPRRVDALLLAGLKRIVGDAYEIESVIQARYRLAGGRVVVTDVRVDGRAARGRIDLSPASRGCRGNA